MSSLLDRVILAFTEITPTSLELNLIHNLIENPGSSCAELSKMHHWKPNVWDMQFGKLCRKRIHILTDTIPLPHGSKPLHLLTTSQRGADGKLRYSAKPELSDAFFLQDKGG